jgi:hypothetical protein
MEATGTETLLRAEQQIAELEPKAATLLNNLALLTGEAARLAAERLNAISEQLSQLRAVRDTSAEFAKASALAFPSISALAATDALSSAIVDAIEAMRNADPDPARSHSVLIWTQDGPAVVELPDSWKARQAALAVLGVTVTVHQQTSDTPRWVAEMRLPGGTAISGSWPQCVPTYMSPTSRC